jgi:hypothetical protein
MAAKKRFLHVEGIAGHPVTDPHNPSANPARFAGWTPRTGDPLPDAEHLLDHYEPQKQVIADHADLRGAIKRGQLTLVAECVALNHDAARVIFAAKSVAKPTSSTTRPAAES